MARAKGIVVLSVAQREALERLVRAYTTPQHIAQRARIVLMSAQGRLNVEQGAALAIDHQRVRRWRRRWAACQAAIAAAEANQGADPYIDDLVLSLLCDERRAGRKPTFTAEQVAQIIAVACEKPTDCGREVSHWTARELADEMIKRGIVVSISPRHVNRILEEAAIKPHRSRYWLQREDQGHRSRGIRARLGGGVRDVSNGR